MSFEFQSTLVNVTPNYRISGNQIGGVRIENNGGIKVARVIVTNDVTSSLLSLALTKVAIPDAIYAALSADLFEITEGVLLNEAAISKVEYDAEKVVIDLEGSDRLFTFMPDAVVTEATSKLRPHLEADHRRFRRSHRCRRNVALQHGWNARGSVGRHHHRGRRPHRRHHR